MQRSTRDCRLVIITVDGRKQNCFCDLREINSQSTISFLEKLLKGINRHFIIRKK